MKATVIGSGILLMALVVGCSSSPEDAVMKEMIATMNQAADLLEKGDMEGFKKLEPKMKELGEKAEKWSKDKKDEMEKKYKSEAEAAQKRMMAAMLKGLKGKMPGIDLPDK